MSPEACIRTLCGMVLVASAECRCGMVHLGAPGGAPRCTMPTPHSSLDTSTMPHMRPGMPLCSRLRPAVVRCGRRRRRPLLVRTCGRCATRSRRTSRGADAPRDRGRGRGHDHPHCSTHGRYRRPLLRPQRVRTLRASCARAARATHVTRARASRDVRAPSARTSHARPPRKQARRPARLS